MKKHTYIHTGELLAAALLLLPCNFRNEKPIKINLVDVQIFITTPTHPQLSVCSAIALAGSGRVGKIKLAKICL